VARGSRETGSQKTTGEKMIRKVNTIAMAVLSVGINCSLAQGPPPPTTLTIDLENAVSYQADFYDPSKYGKNPTVTPSAGAGVFGVTMELGDIVAVNGQPAKGTYVARNRVISASPTPSPGQAIADITRTGLREQIFEILKSDGTPIGTVVALGFPGGPAPPGQPVAERGNWVITGGTGAFLGVRGQEEGAGNVVRVASMAEDPANRRTNGGGTSRYFLHLIPVFVPQIVITASGPAVTHSSDFTLVSTSRPASAGEILSLFATGLGPTVPSVDFGQPFPLSPAAAVNSPITVTVNGKPVEFLAAVGLPGAVDGYQVNFRMPADIAKGTATVQVSAAWIAGAPVSIAVQ
jgi:hypothetical protein